VIAEAGSNHNGDWEIARRLIAEAAAAGADAVKFQAFRADRLYPRGAGAADYLGTGEDIYDVIARIELPEAWLPRLAEAADERRLDLLVSAFDEESAATVDPFVPAHKLASYELTYSALLRRVASTGKPLIVSTGAATLAEIGAAVGVARDAGAADLTLLQCTAAYPARPEALNVSAMVELRDRFSVDVGLSDHSLDPVVAPVLAVAYGAAIVEKHFTLDRALPGPDHRFAVEPRDLARLVEAVRLAEVARGPGAKVVHDDELELRTFARRLLFTTRPLRAGDVIDADAIAILRAGKYGDGLPPDAYATVVGRRTARAVAAATPLVEADLA